MTSHQTDIPAEKQELFALLDTDIKTNMGKIPVQDYLEMKAYEYGYDSYKELYQDGCRITGYEKISPQLMEEWRRQKEKEHPSLKNRLSAKQAEASLYNGNQKNRQPETVL